MARPLKDGVDYFSLDCQMDDEIKYIEAEFGLDGFAMIIKLWQKIYGDKGYYCAFTRTVRLMFAQSIRKGINFVDEVITRCTEYGIFDRQLYKKYGVLTSAGIQKRYAKMTERRNLFTIDGRYLLISAPQNWIIDNNNSVNVDDNAENVGKSTESKVKESKVNTEIEREKTTTTTRTGASAHACEENEGFRPPSAAEVAEYFKNSDPYIDLCCDAMEEARKFCAYNENRGWDCLPNWQVTADLWATRAPQKNEGRRYIQ